MRSPAMVRERDRLPNYYPVFEDLATPLGLASRLEPDAKVVRLVGMTKSLKKIKNTRHEKTLCDGYGSLEFTRYDGGETKLVINCLDRKEKHIEQEYPISDIASTILSPSIPEIVIKRIDYLRPAAKSCDICDNNGIDSLLATYVNADTGPITASKNSSKPVTYSDHFLKLMAENRREGIYPEPAIRRYLKAVLQMAAMKGYDGGSLIPTNNFLPEPYGQRAIESIITPWSLDRWWTTIRKPAMLCAPAWQSVLTNDFRGRAIA